MRILDTIRNKVIPMWTKKSKSGSFVVQKQWIDSSRLTDDLYDELYERNGISHKLVNRLADDRFDKWYNPQTDNEELKSQVNLLNSDKQEGLKIRNTFKKARKFALRHGYSVVFLEYEDQAESLEEPVKNPRRIIKLGNIMKTEITKIELNKDPNSLDFGEIEFYVLNSKIFGDINGTEIKIHVSRTIHVVNGDGKDPDGVSMFKSMYNWINMFDDMAWSMGQSYFRYGSGFPVLTVKGWSALPDDVKDDYQNQWKNVTSMTGWVGGGGDTVEFKGVAGRALSPKEYMDAGFTLISSSGDLPFALLAGVNAGAVTGSETNLKDYYSDVSSKQTLEEQPLLEQMYAKLIETGQLQSDEFIIEWNSLFVHTDKEKAEISKLNAEAQAVYFRTGIVPKEVADDLENGDLVEVESRGQPTSPFDIQDYLSKKESSKIPLTPESQHSGGYTDKRKIIKRDKKLVSKFSEPEFVKMEDSYLKELVRIFKLMEIATLQIVKGFNADKKDALNEKDFKKMQTSIDAVFAANKPLFKPIVDTNIKKGLEEGILSSEKELNLNIPVPKNKINGKLNVIENEHLKVVDTLADDIAKDISTKLGIISLNPVEGFKAIEQQIKDSFSSKTAQLKMGVGNEFNSALNQGNLLGYEDSGVVVGKEWVAFIDSNTTNTCVTLNGEVVEIGKSFSSGDYAPPAMDPPHPCRSSLRAVKAEEFELLDQNQEDIDHLHKSADNQIDLALKKKEIDVLQQKEQLIRELSADLNKDQAYNCECIKCGFAVSSDKHCKDIKCSKCGGQMRRKERPGPGTGS